MSAAADLPTPAPESRQVQLFGVTIDALTRDEALARCHTAIDSRSRLLIGVVNAAKIVAMRKDALLRDSLLECDIVLADGQSVVWAAKLLGRPLPERITGIDLFTDLLAAGEGRGDRPYFLGARREVLDRMIDVVAQRWPRLTVAGHRDGYFPREAFDEVAAGIRAAGADMLFLGMSSPTKEIFLGRNADSLGVPVLHGVGGSFDIVAGVTKRAPGAWQRVGMEWAYRFWQEPARMWRRYLIGNLAFIGMVIKERIRATPAYVHSGRDSS